jgi:hypothetical protein
MPPSPEELRSALLTALGKLSGFRAGFAVPCADVIREVTSSLDGGLEDALQSTATAQIRAGFLAHTIARGTWALTPKGVERAQTILWIFPATDTPPTSTVTALFADMVVPPSPWADDKAGVCVFDEVHQDTYSDDNYIRVLGVSHILCFGGYRRNTPVCGTCPIAGSCQAHQFLSFSEVASTLNRQRNTPAKPTPITPEPVSKSAQDKALQEILDGLKEPNTPPTPVERGVDQPVPVDSLCYLCFKKLSEGSVETFITGKGFRHKGPCPP